MADNISLIVNETIDNVVINPSITTEVVDVNVTGTDTYVDISVTPNLTTVNINRQVPVGVNGQDLQSVTDIGATTTNGITITVGDGGGDGISSTSSQGSGVYGSSNEAYGVYGTSPSATGVYGTSDNGYGVQGYSASGVAIYGDSIEQIGVKANSYSGTAMYVTSDIGTGLFVSSEDIGASIYSNGIGLEVNGNGTIAIEANLGNSNKGLVINSGTSSTGNFIELDKNGVDKLVVNQAGELTATKLIKQGGTSAQLLAANGDSITAGTNITISGGTISSTGGGGGGATNLSPSQTATNFTINSDTGTDATIPLGNGTLAGATLNDYTTAEKNKLSGIATGAEVNVNADWNATSGDAQILNKPGLEQVLGVGNEANNEIVLSQSSLGSMTYGGFSTTYLDTTDRRTTLFYADGIYTSGLQFILPSNKVDDRYILATIDDIPITTDFVPYTGATTDVDLGINDITANSFIKSGGTSSQILAADGSVITAGNNITITGGQISSVGGAGGGGSSVNYYLNGGTSQGTFGGTTYYEFSKTAVIGTGADFSRGSNGLIASFITDVADPSLLLIPAGNWNLEFFFSLSSAGGSPSFYVELYKYDGTTFTSIASSSATPEGITNGTTIDAYFTPLAVPETVLTVNDRLAIRVFVNASSKTITLHTQNGHLCEVITTFTDGLTALNGLQAQVQNFTTGTTGTDFAINSSGSTHTFNLPSASATARGVVTTASQTFAGDKTFTGAIGASNLSGTNTGDNATNTQYSGLATSKQDTLQSTVNIKSINGNSILGSGDLTISGTGISSLNGLTGATQTFSITTNTGTGIPAWTSSGTNHQLNIPIAGGATTTGLITGTSQSISGSKTFLSNPEIPVPAGNTAPCIVLGAAGGGGATGTLSIGDTVNYPNGQEMQRVKGVTSNIQTQLDGKQPTLTAGNGINITTNTISTVDTSRAAYTMLANNTNSSAVPTTQPFENLTNQVYSGTIVWTGGTAPSGTTDHTYSLSQIGNLVTLTINLAYGTAAGATVSSVTMELPSTAPTPALPSSVTTALDVVNYGSGMIISSKSLATTSAAFCALRLKSTSPNVFEIVISRVASTHRYAYATIKYFV